MGESPAERRATESRTYSGSREGAFSRYGANTSLDDIAREAGVGLRGAIPLLPHSRTATGSGGPSTFLSTTGGTNAVGRWVTALRRSAYSTWPCAHGRQASRRNGLWRRPTVTAAPVRAAARCVAAHRRRDTTGSGKAFEKAKEVQVCSAASSRRSGWRTRSRSTSFSSTRLGWNEKSPPPLALTSKQRRRDAGTPHQTRIESGVVPSTGWPATTSFNRLRTDAGERMASSIPPPGRSVLKSALRRCRLELMPLVWLTIVSASTQMSRSVRIPIKG